MKSNKIYFVFNILFYFIFGFSALSNAQILDITTPAKQVVIFDHEADEILFEKNSNNLMKPASMAKVMTSYIVFDKIKDKSLKMSDTFLVSEKSLENGRF